MLIGLARSRSAAVVSRHTQSSDCSVNLLGLSSPEVDSAVNYDVNYFLNSLIIRLQSGPRRLLDVLNLERTGPLILALALGGHSGQLHALIEAFSALRNICIRFSGDSLPGLLCPFEQGQNFSFEHQSVSPPTPRTFIKLMIIDLTTNDDLYLISSIQTSSTFSRSDLYYMFIQHDFDRICLQLVAGIVMKP